MWGTLNTNINNMPLIGQDSTPRVPVNGKEEMFLVSTVFWKRQWLGQRKPWLLKTIHRWSIFTQQSCKHMHSNTSGAKHPLTTTVPHFHLKNNCLVAFGTIKCQSSTVSKACENRSQANTACNYFPWDTRHPFWVERKKITSNILYCFSQTKFVCFVSTVCTFKVKLKVLNCHTTHFEFPSHSTLIN